ncbi:MAG: DUF3899 domain-containing protein [Eubacteriales bacterium]|nr:DUF3899 domain-containing protein [Eubacteriales bacterium]
MRRHLGKLIALLCGTLLCVLSLLYQRPAQISGAREWLRILSNAALLTGVLLSGLSALLWISGEGLFDGLRYTMSSLLARLRGVDKKYASYFDYTQREKKKRMGNPMMLPGLFFLAAAILLTLFYYL